MNNLTSLFSTLFGTSPYAVRKSIILFATNDVVYKPFS
ncbi:unnamed protein product [Schistosoma mattheei]|uniref:Uncharacterized protein n=1 Tax=Schistosoma mattheei TaxID=31246 RepID=A0A3P8J4C8_9TREM|nr:unnamed protein product [Schistosoma mattheei]